MEESACVIIGAGVAGAATAYHLARRGLRGVALLEQEATEARHSSGRSAAMVRQVVPDPAIAALAREGARFLAAARGEWDRPEIFSPQGSILLAGAAGTEALRRDARVAREGGAAVEPLDRDAVEERISLARGAPIEVAVETRDDGLADAHALIQGYLAGLREGGGRLLRSWRVEEVLVGADRRVRGVRANRGELRAPRVVNAAGAWASRIAEGAGAAPIPLTPYRRHIAQSGRDERVRPEWPFLWHLDEAVYFRPESGGLLLCACDQIPDEPGEARPSPDGLERLARRVSETFPLLADITVARWWAGHRTFAPDRRFVIGPDPRIDGFWWVAGLGGHGITTSGAVGRLAADLILDPSLDRENPFTPARRFPG